jgi:Xaa-Pro aminopeptidase
MTERDTERIDRIVSALQDAGLDALICTLPENVLLLTGYWPVVGTAIAIATAEGHCAILAPEDENDLAHTGWAHDVRTYTPGSLDSLAGPAESVRGPLEGVLCDLQVAEGTIGFEDLPSYLGASYAAMYLNGAALREILVDAAPQGKLVSGSATISTLRSSLTCREVDRVRLACRITGEAFIALPQHIRPGVREPTVAAALATPIGTRGLEHDDIQRTHAFTWCMSGPNSALAGAAYARTRNRALRPGDLVLVHCNSTVDGLWTDVTRTFCLGEPDERQHAMYEAIFAARRAALEAIRPGAKAADVDGAGRDALRERGFAQYFTHGIGHNVGFSVISAEFPPRLHPASPDRLEIGMTFNIEPAIYIKDYGAIRHCDVVTVRPDGPEVLTAFQADLPNLIVRG